MNPQSIDTFFVELLKSALFSNHRFGLVLEGDDNWIKQQCSALYPIFSQNVVFQLGGNQIDESEKSVRYNQGHFLLGQECRILICDLRSGFDANAFTAASGTVLGGGIVLIIKKTDTFKGSIAKKWLNDAFSKLNVISQNSPLPSLSVSEQASQKSFEEQHNAIEKIIRVADGHRKRPLIMTADRGRGKSSALGIAAAKLIIKKQRHIIVTAPSIAAVQPVFEHAKRELVNVVEKKTSLQYGQAVIEFVAPDDLLTRLPNCDCLFVDEAAAIPIPMLQKIALHYNRCVFSSTIHGYEGCGRGFSLKFQAWLKTVRPNGNTVHIRQPIRWADNDSFEKWLFDTFLLNAESEPYAEPLSKTTFCRISQQQLIEQPHILKSCFALLVSAHYQTTPNDLLLLLSDEAVHVYAAFTNNQCVGCILAVEEGELDDGILSDIQNGSRRPKGHLVPVLLSNHLGLSEAAQQRSLRIMRIAVHPDLHSIGIGSEMLSKLLGLNEYEYYSSSFGATEELIRFWHNNEFVPIKLGSHKDQASGTYSVVMVHGQHGWIDDAQQYFRDALCYGVSSTWSEIDTCLIRALLGTLAPLSSSSIPYSLLKRYAGGGANFDSVAAILDKWWQAETSLITKVEDLFIRRVVQRKAWSCCAREFGLTGKKQTEKMFREQLGKLLKSLN